ncbi:unnamed protein product [Lathyrus sativus]|nr:unnamed protein product [Lathyrus sativus]
MKFKPFIFMFFLCAIFLISVVAIRPFKSGAIEESKTKGLGRGHSDDVDWVGSGTWGGWGGPREERVEGHEGGSEEGGNEESGWGGEGPRDEGGERREGGSEEGGNEGSGWGGEENEGSGWGGGNEGPEEDGSVENGDRQEYP